MLDPALANSLSLKQRRLSCSTPFPGYLLPSPDAKERWIWSQAQTVSPSTGLAGLEALLSVRDSFHEARIWDNACKILWPEVRSQMNHPYFSTVTLGVIFSLWKVKELLISKCNPLFIFLGSSSALFVQLSPLLASLKRQDHINSSFHKFKKNSPFQVKKKIKK